MSSAIGSVGFLSAVSEGTKYAFIDADNFKISFEEALENRGVAKDEYFAFNLSALFEMVHADRYYVYSAVPDNNEPQEWISQLRSTDRYVFRSGRLTEKSGKKKQQGVDVMLALEAQRNAFYKNCNACILFSSDGDFLPLVNAIVDAGTKMVVVSFGYPDKSPVARQLRDAADSYIHVGTHLLWSVIRPEHRFSGISAYSPQELQTMGEGIEISLDPKSSKSVLLPDGRLFLVSDEISSQTVSVKVAIFGSKIGAQIYFKLHGPLDW